MGKFIFFILQCFNVWVTMMLQQWMQRVQIEETAYLGAANVLMDLVDNLVQVRIHYVS